MNEKVQRADFLDSNVWGPHFWFVLHTMAYTYPETANAVTKRKYYDFISNVPLFLPDPEMGNQFAFYLDKYPISPYLDKRESFMRWVNFIHNKINKSIGKEPVSFAKGIELYKRKYKTMDLLHWERVYSTKTILYTCIVLFLVTMAVMFK